MGQHTFTIIMVIEMMFNKSIQSMLGLFPRRNLVHVEEIRKVSFESFGIGRSAFTLLLWHACQKEVCFCIDAYPVIAIGNECNDER
jgi:hypothetical protein